MDTLILVLDLCGTFVFATSGAKAAKNHDLDLFGVLVLAFAAATAGGVVRDVVLGATPPASIGDSRYIAVSIVAGLLIFVREQVCEVFRQPVLLLDAAGLGIFVVAGTMKSLQYGLEPIAAVLLGVISGVGGGMLRDMLVSQVPSVLRGELYAAAALIAATIVVLGDATGAPAAVTAIVAAASCLVIRMLAIRNGWNLPRGGLANNMRWVRQDRAAGANIPRGPAQDGMPQNS